MTHPIAVAPERMNILLVSHYTLPHVGGIEVLLDQFGRALVQQGHEVTVISSRTGAAAAEQRGGSASSGYRRGTRSSAGGMYRTRSSRRRC